MGRAEGPAEARHVRNDADAGSPFHITDLAVRFEDKGQERRFFRQQLPPQRSVTRGVVVIVLLIIGAQWLVAGRFDQPALAESDTRILIAAAVLLLIPTVGLWTDRSYRWTYRWIVAAMVTVPVAVAALIACGNPITAQPMLLVTGGVIVSYFISRLDFLGSTFGAVLYTAVTVPVWLFLGPPAARVDLLYTLAATLVAHLVGILEARRIQRTLRTAFAQHEDLKQLSAIDVLTGLANRRAFDETMAAVWKSWLATGRAPSVLMLDIDHFKKLNDTLGHAAGDIALRMVADAIRGALRKDSGHVVARYGGEEFVILLPVEEHQVTHAIAERVVTAVRSSGVERSVVPRGAPPPAGLKPLTVSVGIGLARASMASPQDLVDAADRALYRAKAEGRDCVRCEDDAPGPQGTGRPL